MTKYREIIQHWEAIKAYICDGRDCTNCPCLKERSRCALTTVSEAIYLEFHGGKIDENSSGAPGAIK